MPEKSFWRLLARRFWSVGRPDFTRHHVLDVGHLYALAKDVALGRPFSKRRVPRIELDLDPQVAVVRDVQAVRGAIDV